MRLFACRADSKRKNKNGAKVSAYSDREDRRISRCRVTSDDFL